MEPVIQNIRNLIVNKQEILLEKMNFGACDASIILFKKKIGIEIPQIFYDFYSLFNGCASSETSIWSAMSLLPLSSILNEKVLMDKLQNQGKFNKWVKDTWWNDGYVPFLSDFSNSLVCLDINGSFNGKTGQIIQWQNDNPARSILFDSFENWLNALCKLIESFENDIIIQKDAFHDYCITHIQSVAKSINPEYPKFFEANSTTSVN